MQHTQNGKRSSNGNGSGAAVLGVLEIETQYAIAGMISAQSAMAIDWQNSLSDMAGRAEHLVRNAKTPKIRKQWQMRLAAIERARVLMGAKLIHVMRTAGEDVADVIEKEFRNPYARAFAGELRKFEPRDTFE